MIDKEDTLLSYRDVLIEDMSREQLIEALSEMSGALIAAGSRELVLEWLLDHEMRKPCKCGHNCPQSDT